MASLTFFAAINAARNEGKRVRRYDCSEVIRWDGNQLVYELNKSPVGITIANLINSWQIIPDPPKRYSFMEAVELMKSGRFMKSSENYTTYKWLPTGHIAVVNSDNWTTISLKVIESQWEEVQ